MATAASCQVSSRPATCPAWLQAALADIEQRVQSLSLTLPPAPEDSTANNSSDTFAERAENYYQKRPQLLALLRDLHNRYLHLADRYSQSLLKLNAAPHSFDVCSDDDDRPPLSSVSTFSDAETSFLSFNLHSDVDPLVVELTMSLVERNVLQEVVWECERVQLESARRMELQGSLLEVMESERVVLVEENARLERRAEAAEGERVAMEAEVGYLRRKAGEMAKWVGRMREERRVWEVGRRVEMLAVQVEGIERRERERREVEGRREREVERLREENRRLGRVANKRRRRKRGGGWWWWGWSWGEELGGAQGKEGEGERGVGCCFGEGNPCFCL